MIPRLLRVALVVILGVQTSFAQASPEDPFERTSAGEEEWQQARLELLKLEQESMDRIMPAAAVIVVAFAAMWIVDKYVFGPSDEVVQAQNDLEMERRYPGTIPRDKLVREQRLLQARSNATPQLSVDQARATSSDGAAKKIRYLRIALVVLNYLGIAAGFQLLLAFVCGWKIFQRAGHRGWSVLVPFYNIWVLFEVAGIGGWLSLVPGVNLLVWALVVPFGLARRFGRSWRFGLGLAVGAPIFYPVLAFTTPRQTA